MKTLIKILFLLLPLLNYGQDVKKVSGVTDTNVKKTSGVSDTNIKKISGVTFSSAFVGILDDYPGAGIAYSVRKLDADYAGSCMRIKRSSDNTETDIGFTSAGNLDESAITSFCGAGNGVVVTWYDQSGNGNDLTSVNGTGNQICASGVVNTRGGKPTIILNGDYFKRTGFDVADVFGSSQFYLIGDIVAEDVTSVGSTFLQIGTSSSSYDIIISLFSGFSGWFNSAISRYAHDDVSVSDNTEYIQECIMSSSASVTHYLNGVEENQNVSTGSFTPTGTKTLSVGNDYDAFAPTQEVREIIMYPSNQLSNRSGIYTNISTYF